MLLAVTVCAAQDPPVNTPKDNPSEKKPAPDPKAKEPEATPKAKDTDSAKAPEEKKSTTPTEAPALKAVWQNGLRLETADRDFHMHFGGLLHVDSAWWQAGDAIMYGPGGVGSLNDGANFRRLRLHTNGTMYDTVDWTIEVGYENRLPQFFNAFAEIPNLIGTNTLRAGHFREPFGMDALTSYNNLTFLERSLPLEPLVPFFNLGTMIYGPFLDGRATYATGIFRSNSDAFNAADSGDGGYAYTTRLTLNPVNECDGRSVVHLATAYSYRVLPFLDASGAAVSRGGQRRVVLAARPEIRAGAPIFASTGVITADREQLLGTEVGWSHDSFLLQAEYMGGFIGDAVVGAGDSAPRSTLYFQGFSTQASYFLTGESRPYVRNEGVFGQVRPRANFRPRRPSADKPAARGIGAWEVAVRYSWLDLNDGPVRGALLHNMTLGLNWYLNPQCRLLLNYVTIWRSGVNPGSDGFAQTLAIRFQLEF
jgi:phosphate-selective porin OprO/OprP